MEAEPSPDVKSKECGSAPETPSLRPSRSCASAALAARHPCIAVMDVEGQQDLQSESNQLPLLLACCPKPDTRTKFSCDAHLSQDESGDATDPQW